MDDPESLLLVAVQNALSDIEVQSIIDLDDLVPAIASDQAIVISPSGQTAGQRQQAGGGTIDRNLGVRVTVFQRITGQAKDRRGSQYLSTVGGLNETLERVIDAVDQIYDVINSANEKSEFPEGEGFVMPLVYQRHDPKPVPVVATAYSGRLEGRPGTDGEVAIKRGVEFSGARFMKKVES